MFASLLLLGILIVLTIGLGGISSQSQEIEGLTAIASPPPSSLEALYPPKAEQPIYLFSMLGLDTSFSGIVADLFENDLPHAQANFKKFRAQYVEISRLVPEWEKNYPMGPVEDLGAALVNGDPGKVMAAYEKVGKVCHECHKTTMPQVQQKYRWGDFYAIRAKDPLTNEEVDFPQLKKYLAANFAGISVNTEQGQRENAQKQFQGFIARFQALKETCGNCHDTERKYYVDESLQALVDQLGQALSGSSVDPNTVEKLKQGIGMESCLKCHLVHVPAAFAKFQWEK
jgi:cytochrome c556